MKQFIKELKNEIENFDIKPKFLELKNLAVIKLVLIKLSKICSRDDRFFLYKENISLRRKIYNKNLVFNKKHLKISCKSYCVLIQKILQQLNIKTTLFSAGKDEFKHFALIYTEADKKYYIDPLLDLVNLKIDANTQYFCCDYNKLQDLNILDNEQQSKINSIIKYKESYSNFLKTLPNNLSSNKILKYIILSSNLDSVSDCMIFLAKVIDDAFPNYKSDIKTSYCTVVETTKLKDKHKIAKGLNGLTFQYLNSFIYYFPSTRCFLETPISIKNIYIKPKYDLKNYKYIRKNDANRQIIDNIQFQKIFFNLEKEFNLEEKDISINDGDILIKKLNTKFSIYKHKYLCLTDGSGSFYFKIKNFGFKVSKKKHGYK